MADIVVLGAGMAGVGAALALQARGHAVRLVDQHAPGEETSFGNAGIIQAEACVPYEFPRAPLTLLKYALGLSNDLVIDYHKLPAMLKPLWQYFNLSSAKSHAAITKTYAQLIARGVETHAPLIEAAGAGDLIRTNGFGEIYQTNKGFDAAAKQAEIWAQNYDLMMELWPGDTLHKHEAKLRTTPAGTVFWGDSWSCRNPGALAKAYGALFEARGGTLMQMKLRSAQPTATGWQVQSSTGRLETQHLVVALGPWSPAFLQPLGYDIPMVMKRGYHSHYHCSTPPERGYFLADDGVVVSDMDQGVRITTGAHLTSQGAPENLRQLHRGRAAAGQIFGLGSEVENSRWQGTRPCLPQMVPLVGAAPKHRGLWFHFGHGHQGFTLGPATGEILARVLDGDTDRLSDALAP